MTDAPTSPAEKAVRTYFDAWKAHDFDRFASVLADEVTFTGALGTTSGIEETRKGIEGMSQIVDDIVVCHRWVDGDDVLTWFDLHAKGVDQPLPVANWSHVHDGRITRIQVAFDPRPLLP
jgi:ketosteroid isomerase-like protein